MKRTEKTMDAVQLRDFLKGVQMPAEARIRLGILSDEDLMALHKRAIREGSLAALDRMFEAVLLEDSDGRILATDNHAVMQAAQQGWLSVVLQALQQ
jgi:hypothetical protein